jgi:hypothetical protein
MTRRTTYMPFVMALALIASGCGDDGGSGGTAGTGGSAGTGGTAGTGGIPTGSGSATLTIGDETWEFSSFGCAFGYDATRTDDYSFSSSAFGEHSNGNRVQMQAEIQDGTGQERIEGAGVVYTVYINDIEDFENPAVDWQARGEAPPAGNIVVQINGDRVTAEGLFDDKLTELVVEEVPGTLDATCGDQSAR